MPPAPDPYETQWLPRTRRALAPSGRLSELSAILATETSRDRDEWARFLRRILDGEVKPDPELVFRIDGFLGRPVRTPSEGSPELPF
jgi:hypothetical protein